MLTGVMVACLPEKIGSQKNYRCLAGGIGGVVITEIYCAVIVHIRAWLPRSCMKTFFLVTVSLSASFLHCWQGGDEQNHYPSARIGYFMS